MFSEPETARLDLAFDCAAADSIYNREVGVVGFLLQTQRSTVRKTEENLDRQRSDFPPEIRE